MERKLEDLEKSMKRSNDKQLKIEHDCCQRVSSSAWTTNFLQQISFSCLHWMTFSPIEIFDLILPLLPIIA